LIEVEDPSKAILEQRYAQAVGAALTPVLEGTRPMVLEVQALTSPSHLPAPRRVANGLDFNRLLMLIAVAGRRGGLDLSGQDIIVNVAGGLKVNEPAVDLAIVLAIGSSLHNRALDPGLVAFGELGLGGEVRSVPQAQRRLQEAQRLGLSTAVLPASTPEEEVNGVGLDLSLVRTVRQALQVGLGGPSP
jgi:DNA repair protein RadA/Sms